MLRDHNVVLAIETHFEFTTHELRRLLDMCEADPGDWLGICLDTMNLLTMLEDPVLATERVLPWVVCTHIKDGGILLNSKGLATFPTGIGTGVIDLKKIVGLLTSSDREITFSIEDHGGDFGLPIFDPTFLPKFPDLTVQEFSRLIQMAQQTAQAVRAERCAVTERGAWPKLCEKRLEADIQTLRKIGNP